MEPRKSDAGLPPPEEAALRAEHEELSRRLGARTSIDHVRRGAYASFALFISTGLALKFAWDRWGWGPRPARLPGRYPILFLLAAALAVALAVVTVRAFLQARRLMRVEDADFARIREIRARLGIEP